MALSLPAVVRISTYKGKDRSESNVEEASFEELVEALTQHTITPCSPCLGHDCEYKSGPTFSPGVVPTGKTRADKNVIESNLLVFDLDDITDAQAETLEVRLSGLAHIIHSTHSHRSDHARLRLVVFPSRSIKPKEWPWVWRATADFLGLLGVADNSAKSLCHQFFFPSAAVETPRVGFYQPGEPVDADDMLQVAKARTIEAARAPLGGDQPPSSPEFNTGSVGMDTLRKKLRAYTHSDPHKTELVRRVYRQEPLAEIHKRSVAVNDVCSILAWLIGDDAPAEAVMELIRPSVLAMPREDENDKQNFMEIAAESYRRSRERLVEERAKEQALREALYKRLAKSTHPAEARETGTEQETEREEDDPEAWESALCSGSNGNPTNDGANVEAILSLSPEWKGVIRYNEVTKNVEIHGGPAIEDAMCKASDEKTTAINNWIRRVHGVSVPDHVTKAQIALVAKKNSYNPLQEYLERLTWDGVPRAELALERYFGAAEDLRYIRSVSKKFFVALAARALRPGCKMDTVLVLEGAQGIMKSTALKVLGGVYFVECHLDVTNKDTKMLAARNYLIEIPELTAIRRADTEALKAFFSAACDQFRPPYGASIQEFPRQCVFVGTTNADEYFDDDTGNRRYWPVQCGHIDIDALGQDREQLFAEAVVLFKAGEPWWFDWEEAPVAEAQTVRRLRVNANHFEIIRSWWHRLPTKCRPDHVELVDVITDVLKVPPDRATTSLRVDVGRCMARLGFERQYYIENGVRLIKYVASKELKAARQSGKGYLTLLAGAKPTNATPMEEVVKSEDELLKN